jgi:hypothetical protein
MKAHRYLLTVFMMAGAAFAADIKPVDVQGKWIADNGSGSPQSFVFELRGGKLSGVTCGPCDPAHVFVIEDGSISGDKISFFILREDRGENLAKSGPYRDMFMGTLNGNEIHGQWHREGAGANEGPHGEMVLIGPLRLPVVPPPAAAVPPVPPPPPAK